MTPQAALQLLESEMSRHGLSLLGWKGQLDHARRRFGVCRPSKKVISLSRHLIALNSREEVHDTILHEIAHALAFIEHGENCGHDHRWKEICRRIGARPVRCFNGREVRQPAPKWLLCHKVTGEVFHHYYRRPRTNLKTLYVKGRMRETLGQLELRPAS